MENEEKAQYLLDGIQKQIELLEMEFGEYSNGISQSEICALITFVLDRYLVRLDWQVHKATRKMVIFKGWVPHSSMYLKKYGNAPEHATGWVSLSSFEDLSNVARGKASQRGTRSWKVFEVFNSIENIQEVYGRPEPKGIMNRGQAEIIQRWMYEDFVLRQLRHFEHDCEQNGFHYLSFFPEFKKENPK